MSDTIVRIKSIEIKNFKNVGHGYLNFENPNKEYSASILGLYGQNGSGKTALIDVLALLKIALSGDPIPPHFADYINIDSDFSAIKYEFEVRNSIKKCAYTVFYEVHLCRKIDDDLEDSNRKYKAILSDEVLSYSYKCEEFKVKLSRIIDTTSSHPVFGPGTKYQLLVGKDRETRIDLLVVKQLARTNSRSFIFSKELHTKLRNNCKEDYHLLLIENLTAFGRFHLFVVNAANTGLNSMNVLPFTFNHAEQGSISGGNLVISLDDSSLIPQHALGVVRKVVKDMNVVLGQIIPGLAIDIKELGTQLCQDGSKGYRIQLMSNKNGKLIPLRYESEGIKKLISILQYLIAVYNERSMIVAIDGLDSGIFEYLLGEMLRIISEKGRGQLIFTSHNLRSLEALDRGFIAFTTTNPQNRYIRINNVKKGNNLRDFYYRDITLGGQNESLCEPTNNAEIAFAFREAGISDDT